MSNVVATFKRGNQTLRIIHDVQPRSPREDDNLGTMACWHRRYNLGDDQIGDSIEFLLSLSGEDQEAFFEAFGDIPEKEQTAILIKIIEEKGTVILPLYLYDHSGITMKTSSFGDRWDSGQVGWIYITKEKIEKERVDPEKVKTYLEGEVETYDQYLTGDVYGFEVIEEKTCECCKHTEEINIDSCWGFFGHNWKTNGIFDHVEGTPEEWIEVK